MNKTEINGQNWVSIYKETSFGNKYPSSYLVSLYYRIIKNYLPKIEGNRKYRALDFGCSFGANAMMLRDAGLEVYGVDISPDAIKYCIKNGKFDVEHFVSVNLLTEKWPFSKKMDLIIASEVLYYFSDKDLKNYWIYLKHIWFQKVCCMRICRHLITLYIGNIQEKKRHRKDC